jgi:hypothetical protein
MTVNKVQKDGYHLYQRNDGATVYSVTQLLNRFQHSALLDKVPEAKPYVTIWGPRTNRGNHALWHGTAIHRWIERDITGQDPMAECREHRSFIRWKDAGPVRFLASEAVIYNPEFNYAGTLDTIAEVGVGAHAHRVLIDFKTGKKIYESSWLQIGAYWKAVKDGELAPSRAGILWLGKEGTRFVDIGAKKAEWFGDMFLKLLVEARRMNLV